MADGLEAMVRRIIDEQVAPLKQELADLRTAANPTQRISPEPAAKRARVRLGAIYAALKSGELSGKFIAGAHGGKGRWSILVRDLDAWAEKR